MPTGPGTKGPFLVGDLGSRSSLNAFRGESFGQAGCRRFLAELAMMAGSLGVYIMAYDWTGTRTRRIRRIKVLVSAIVSLAALAVPVFAVSMPYAG
jgi:hypothetical protein